MLTRWENQDKRNFVREMFKSTNDLPYKNYKLYFIFNWSNTGQDDFIVKSLQTENEVYNDLIVEESNRNLDLLTLSGFEKLLKMEIKIIKWIARLNDDTVINMKNFDKQLYVNEENHVETLDVKKE